jgi:predicted alpha/beta hydrolase family esterase
MSVLIVPGLGGSGPDHWQSLWEGKIAGAARVELGAWDDPEPQLWEPVIEQAVAAAGPDAVLVAHSLGCVLVARCAKPQWRVKAALLVAPADADRTDMPDPVRRFAPMPRQALPFRSMVVASRDDPYMDLPRAREFAGFWGSAFRDVGSLGHINSDSGLGSWPEGRGFLLQLLEGR